MIDAGIISMGDGLDGVSLHNAGLESSAAALAETYPEVSSLVAGLQEQQAMIDALVAALRRA